MSNSGQGDLVLIGNRGISFELVELPWLYVFTVDELDADGGRFVTVYRSPLLGEASDLWHRAMDIVGDAEEVERTTVADDQIVGGRAEMILYRSVVWDDLV